MTMRKGSIEEAVQDERVAIPRKPLVQVAVSFSDHTSALGMPPPRSSHLGCLWNTAVTKSMYLRKGLKGGAAVASGTGAGRWALDAINWKLTPDCTSQSPVDGPLQHLPRQ